jgi:hypothetical protein
VGDLARARGAAVAVHVADDQRAIAEAELRAVVLSNPHPLREAERLGEPGDRLPDVGVDEHRDDGRVGDGTVLVHPRLSSGAGVGGQAGAAPT